MKTYSRGDAYPADIVAWAAEQQDRLKFRVLPPLVLYDAAGGGPTIGLPILPTSDAKVFPPVFARITAAAGSLYGWRQVVPLPDGTWEDGPDSGDLGTPDGAIDPRTGRPFPVPEHTGNRDPMREVGGNTRVGMIRVVAFRYVGGGPLVFQRGCSPQP